METTKKLIDELERQLENVQTLGTGSQEMGNAMSDIKIIGELADRFRKEDNDAADKKAQRENEAKKIEADLEIAKTNAGVEVIKCATQIITAGISAGVTGMTEVSHHKMFRKMVTWTEHSTTYINKEVSSLWSRFLGR